ncbi:type IV secretion system protein VirB10 [Mesorhizobium hawassense]|uniref:Type IV secretion system protein VirB10 n=1 Tax=Mesorhizobium hawassense TaxID=1209954 RepID=A0A330H372_9HYPH|nr:type IV secretion system protein VirB10 [Mesorhizobium hawassense]RAZ82148.1 type IV secretion system protein VirB10 [Mesorhizobium hawassense]
MNVAGSQSLHDVDASGSLVAEPGRRRLSGPQKLAVAGLVLTLSLSLIWLGARSNTQDDTPRVSSPVLSNTEPFRPAPSWPPKQTAQPLDLAATPTPQESDPASAPMPATAVDKPPEPAVDSSAQTPIFAYTGNDQPPDNSEPRENKQPGIVAEVPSVNDLSSRLKSDMPEPSRATLLPHPDFVITQGTIIPCILQTAVDTNLPGYVKCVLPQDIRGATNNVVLLDRGTTVVGEIQRGLRQGDGRVFVIWSRIETPDHAVVSLASPGADELGRSGMPGLVDNHFWQRFGGAVLLSVVQGGLQAAGQYATNSGGGGSINNFQSNGGQTIDTALRATVDIPPTLRKNQGDTASIFVAKDLDFSDVYELRATTAVSRKRNGQP